MGTNFSGTELGRYLEKLRTDLKLTLRDAAEKSGLSHTYIRDIELGVNRKTKAPVNPSPETLRRLSKAYGNPSDELYETLMKMAGHLDPSEEDTKPKGNFAYYGGGDDWTDEEKAAAQAEVLKAQTQRNKAKLLENLGKDVLDKLAQLPEADREMALQQLKQTVEFLNKKNKNS
jgi:transcriptional regulator with XRE-family HTH domain